MNLHVVSHTHWDREWYLTHQEFRYRLIFLIDKLIDILDNNPEYKFFMLDGQTVMLEDYLEIKPYNRRKLEEFVRSGRIQIGPWYVLPDMFLISGESIIRNIKLGIDISKSFGSYMNIGYMPDQFGHISKMPQLLKGFGVDAAVIWRGIGGGPDEVMSEFFWESTDGSRILTIRLSNTDGYFNAKNLSLNIDLAVSTIRKAVDKIKDYATTSNILLMNGVDHQLPQGHLPEIVRAYNQQYTEDTLIHSTLESFVNSVKSEQPSLKIISGELRDSEKSEIFAGTLSSRLYLRQSNEARQVELEFYAEPLCAISWALGNTYPNDFLNYCWKQYIKNHPHDSICGCSIDAVHREMMSRYEIMSQLFNDLIYTGLIGISKKICQIPQDTGSRALLIYNPLPWSRSDIINTVIEFPIEDNVKDFKIIKDISIPYKVEKVEVLKLFDHVKSFEENVAFKEVIQYHVTLGPVNLVPMGITNLSLDPVETNLEESNMDNEVKVYPFGNIMENSNLKIEFNPDGSFNLTDKSSGMVYRNMNQFEDGGDRGDMYIYCRPENDILIFSLGKPAEITLEAECNGFIRYKVVQTMSIPESIGTERDKRSDEYVDMQITSHITLGKDSKRVDIVTEFENIARDHVLRVLFPSGIHAEYTEAESAFDVVKREIRLPEVKDWCEDPSPAKPQQNFVDINNGKFGLMVANKGLTEYEAMEDGVIALTLVRAVEWGSRGDLHNCRKMKNPDGTPALPFMKEPEAQCPGRHVCYYSVIPHSGDWLSSGVWREAYNHKVRSFSIMPPSNNLGADTSFIMIDNPNIMISAVKKSDVGNALIIRLYNLSSNPERCNLKTVFNVKGASYTNLIEERQGDISVNSDGAVQLELQKKEIKTVALHLER